MSGRFSPEVRLDAELLGPSGLGFWVDSEKTLPGIVWVVVPKENSIRGNSCREAEVVLGVSLQDQVTGG